MLIHSASQLLTLAGGPQRRHLLSRLGILENGAVLVRDGTILAVGSTLDLLREYPDEARLDAGGCAVLPGFVDPHTHVVWAGDSAAEFEMKMAGAQYLEILAAGGAILSTVCQTHQASNETLVNETRPRLQCMFAHGTTTAEAKTGYGLQTETELRIKGEEVQLQGLAGGIYTFTPYDTWQGTFLTPGTVNRSEVQPCTVSLPDFNADMAFKIEGK